MIELLFFDFLFIVGYAGSLFFIIKEWWLNSDKQWLYYVSFIPKLLNTFRPIFILGMPRSGTTLVEQIISSHSEVEGAGELNDISIFGKDIVSGKIAINANNFIKLIALKN